MQMTKANSSFSDMSNNSSIFSPEMMLRKQTLNERIAVQTNGTKKLLAGSFAQRERDLEFLNYVDKLNMTTGEIKAVLEIRKI